MIQNLKQSLAKEKIAEFFDSMQKLGFQKEETLSFIEESLKGENHE